MENLVSKKTIWKTYTKEEQQIVQNAILLVGLSKQICDIKLVKKPENENSLETVNEKEAEKIEKKAKDELKKIEPLFKPLAG